MIIFLYLLKEVLSAVFASTGILLLIFLSTQLIHYLTGAALGKYAVGILLHLMALQAPYLLGLLMPVGFYVAVLMAYGRLYADREMIILQCSGVSEIRLLGMTLIMAAFVVMIVGIFNFWIMPKVALSQQQLMADAKAAPIIETLLPGRFFSFNNNVLFVSNVSKDHQVIQNLFYASKDKTSWSVVHASNGEEEIMPDGEKYLIINNGYRYQGIPGQDRFEIAQFNQYKMPLTSGSVKVNNQVQMMPTTTIWDLSKSNRMAAAELQWRISLPLSVFLLALLAVPLSHVNPRQGRFGQLIPAIMIYIIYANLMFMDRSWIGTGVVPVGIGVWWLHGLVLMLALILLAYRSNSWQIFKQKNTIAAINNAAYNTARLILQVE